MPQINFLAGTTIEVAAQELIALAFFFDEEYTTDFNGVEIRATPETKDPDEIVQYYFNKLEEQRLEYLASPEGIARQAEIEAFRAKAAQAKAEGILHFTVANEALWKQCLEVNTEEYGAGIMRFAARWANLMEAKITAGSKLEDIADKCGREADVEGITGFMEGAAAFTLAQVWVHGEQLRHWYNLRNQIGDEGERANESGGILNPACITISL